MTHRTKALAALAAALLLGIALWQVLIEPPAAPPAPESNGHGTPPAVTASLPEDGEGDGVDAEGARQIVPSTPAAEGSGDGSMLVEVTYEEDGSPVPGLTIILKRRGADHQVSVRREPTDSNGVVRFVGLESGRWWVNNSHNNDVRKLTEVHAGKETRVELVLSVGIRITGVVVDRDGTPVAGAQILRAPLSWTGGHVEHVADTGPDGRFALRSCPLSILIGARAHGHAPSRLQFFWLQEGDSKDLRIVLPGPGGTVEGIVFGPDGTPVSDAIVRIGAGQVSAIVPSKNGASATAALERTGADGKFRAVGLSAGDHPAQVRAAGLAPWTGTCTVANYVVVPLLVTLGPGMSCTGVVLGVDGAPLAKVEVEVEVGSWRDFAHYRVFSAADGNFRLDGLPPGEVVLRCRHESGKAEAVVHGGPGDTVSCELRLGSGLVLKGRVVTEVGEPVPAMVLVVADGVDDKPVWTASSQAREDGRFAVPNCPEGQLLAVTLLGSQISRKRFDGIDPRNGEQEFRVSLAPRASGRLVGKVVGPNGQPVARGRIAAWETSGDSNGHREAYLAEGTFEFGPLPPGSWRVSVRAEGHPYLMTDPWPVVADAVVDVGTLWLSPSGKIRARLKNEHGLKPTLWVSDKDMSRWPEMRGDGVEQVSEPLAPGQYSVSVFGRGIASQVLPVTVRVGEESLLDITVEPGQLQRFQWTAPAPLSELQLQVLRGGTVVARFRFRARGSRPVPARWERSLAPGDYVVEARGDGLSARVPFTVSAGKDDPVQFALR